MLQKRIWWSDKIPDVVFVIQKTVVYIPLFFSSVKEFKVSKGKDVEKCPCLFFVAIVTFDTLATNLCLWSQLHPSLSLSLPAPLQLCISESECTLNSYVLVSYGYDLRWHAGVPFPFSALPAPYRHSHNVRSVHKTRTRGHLDAVQTSALTHALHIIIVI